jgi:predicted dithiol-disulfide oxidoreductase (DUF899 family)
MRLPNEPDDYRAAREALLREEVLLRRQIEDVAARRRALPLGGEVPEDYVFTEWDDAAQGPCDVRLSDLFSAGKDTLFLYSFMYIPDGSGNPIGSPCPSCTSIIDAVSGAVRHLTPRINVAVSAKAPIQLFRRHAEDRGWHAIRLLSAGASTYNRDYLAEAEDGAQYPIATVFVRRDGRIRHFWSSELFYVANVPSGPRHVDFMWPMWQIFDCTPDGRGDEDL